MCYRVSTPKKEQLQQYVGDILLEDYEHYYHVNGYDHPGLPTLLSGHEDRVQPVSWGFVPFYIKTEADAKEIRKRTLNARSETIFTTPMFRAAAPGRRCLIFVDGFFEWKHEGKDKIPHYIQMPDHQPFALGGLWSAWHGTNTSTVITTEANELMATIHNSKKRMPLIVPEDDWGRWLDPATPEEEVKGIMRPYPEGFLDAREIGRLVTARGADTNVPEVQQAVG